MTDALRFGPIIEVKRADASTEGTFSGYGSTFGGPDRANDIIARGAFSKSLKEHERAGSAPALLWQHDPGQPIGKWLSLSEDQRGLRVEGKLTLAIQRAKDAFALIQDGALSLSIGYRVRADGIDGRNRVLKDIELLEISLVSVPANPRAQVTAVKDLRPSDLQHILQDCGFSQREAKRIVAGGWRALRTDNSPELSQAATLLREHAAHITSKTSR